MWTGAVRRRDLLLMRWRYFSLASSECAAHVGLDGAMNTDGQTADSQLEPAEAALMPADSAQTLGPTVTHLSRAKRVPLMQVLGGPEYSHMTPALAANLSVLDEPLACWMVADEAQVEVNLLDRYLDILATAEVPGTDEQVQVAIENQYGTADADHFGRLVGWYMPETGAQMGVLIAENFAPQLIKAIADGAVVRPEHGLWLVEASGYVVNGQRLITYATRACSLPRPDQIQRERVFRKGPVAGGNSSESEAEANRRAADFFDYIARTSTGWLGARLRGSSMTSGYYRTIEDNGGTCHLSLFVGQNRVSIGSCYLKANFDEATLDALGVANQTTEVEPEPARRYLRGSWWDIRLDVGRDTPPEQRPAELGDDLERAIAALRPAIDQHQAALLRSAGPPG